MIIDTLENSHKYLGLHKSFAKAFEFVKAQNLSNLEVAKYSVDGIEIHAAVSLKEGVEAKDAKFEAHNNYMDIQVCPIGEETIGWKPRSSCKDIKVEYNEQKDVIFFNDTPDTYFKLKSGQFAIFFPEDVHAPMIGQGEIKKLVVKVKI